jgi:hypothetical protein
MIKGKTSSLTVKTINKEVTREESVVEVVLKGIAETLAVDSKGQEIKTSYTIDECYQIVGGKKVEIISKGKVLTAWKKDKASVFYLDDRPVAKDIEKLVSEVVSPHEPESSTDNDTWGMKSPVSIGQEWPMDEERAALFFSDFNIIDTKSMTGSTKLKGIKTHKGIKCYDVQGELKVGHFISNDPSMIIDDGYIRIKVAGLFPVAGKDLTSMKDSVTMVMRLVVHGKQEDGSEIKVDATSERLVEQESTPLPAK